MIDSTTILSRKAGREAATAAAELVVTEAARFDAAGQAAF